MIAIFLNENQTLVRLLYLVHVASLIGAFGPMFLYPRLRRAGETSAIAALHMRLVFPSLILLWVVGMGMAGVNEFSLAKTYWITGSIVLWLVALAASWFLIKPALDDSSPDASKKMAMGVGITHLVLVLGLWLMIFKPFVDGTYQFNP